MAASAHSAACTARRAAGGPGVGPALALAVLAAALTLGAPSRATAAAGRARSSASAASAAVPMAVAAAIGAADTGDAASRVQGEAQLGGAGGRYQIRAASLEVDGRTHQAILRDVTITQGDRRVSADHATATDFNSDNSRWTFTGNVHISSGQHGTLQSDRATVEIRAGRIESALATGHPATFEQTASKAGLLAHGHADSIEYSFATSTVRLTGNAWLEYGDNQITDPVLVYDIRQQKLRTAPASESGERVHITILPKKAAGAQSAVPGRKPKGPP